MLLLLHRHSKLLLSILLLLLWVLLVHSVALVVDGQAHDRLALAITAVGNSLVVLDWIHHLLLMYCDTTHLILLLLYDWRHKTGQHATVALAAKEDGLNGAKGGEQASITLVCAIIAPLAILVGRGGHISSTKRADRAESRVQGK